MPKDIYLMMLNSIVPSIIIIKYMTSYTTIKANDFGARISTISSHKQY